MGWILKVLGNLGLTADGLMILSMVNGLINLAASFLETSSDILGREPYLLSSLVVECH